MRTLFAGATLVAATMYTGALVAQPSPDSKAGVPNVVSETVTIKNGATTFAGNFETPMGNGQHGGVVIVAPASGPAADAAKALAKSLAQHGLLALTFDATELTPANTRAALETMRLRGDVNKESIGLVGVGAGAAVLDDVAHDNTVSFAIAIRSIQEGTGDAADPARFAKIEKKVLLVQAMADPFSEKNARYSQSIQTKAKNLTMWTTADDNPSDLAADQELLSRISRWAADRAS